MAGKIPKYANSTSQRFVVFYVSSILEQNLKLRPEVFKGPETKASPPTKLNRYWFNKVLRNGNKCRRNDKNNRIKSLYLHIWYEKSTYDISQQPYHLRDGIWHYGYCRFAGTNQAPGHHHPPCCKCQLLQDFNWKHLQGLDNNHNAVWHYVVYFLKIFTLLQTWNTSFVWFFFPEVTYIIPLPFGNFMEDEC